MISSDRKALKVGTSLLVVDGEDETLMRKAEISLRPSRGQAYALEHGLLVLSRDSYNASLQHRREAWHQARFSVSTFEQFKEIDDELREARKDLARFGTQPVRSAIRRADEGMAGFFRRVGDGQSPGYPRFKSARRWRSAFYDEPVSWALRHLEGGHRALYLQGIGDIELSESAACQLRRLLARGGEPRTLSVTKTRAGAWRACVGFRGIRPQKLESSEEVGGLDRGINVTAALADGTLLVMPRFLRQARDRIAKLQRRREEVEKFSPEWKDYNKKIAKVYAKARHRCENWARHRAKEIVARYGVVVLERLELTHMTRSAKGTTDKPGRRVRAKSGLNRSLHEAALGRLAYWICVRAEDAGRRVWKVDPKHSSQECVACGHTERANRMGTRFACCRCGHRAHADVNAAQVLTARGQGAEARWRALGCPQNERPRPRLQRRSDEPGRARGGQHGAGSAPHASTA